jgi:hypothetical protein
MHVIEWHVIKGFTVRLILVRPMYAPETTGLAPFACLHRCSGKMQRHVVQEVQWVDCEDVPTRSFAA